MLETIDKGERTASHPVPLLFIHGGCHAAWCWDEPGWRDVAERIRGWLAERGL